MKCENCNSMMVCIKMKNYKRVKIYVWVCPRCNNKIEEQVYD